jgi:hypothetical protein
MTNNGKTVINLAFRNETKGALRYQEVDAQGHALNSDADGAVVATIYFRKAKMNGTIPQKLRVEISPA